MPCPYPKGSQEAKEFMAQLRARRGKGMCGGKRISVRMKKGGAILPSILLGILAVKGAKKLISQIRGGEDIKSVTKKIAEDVEKRKRINSMEGFDINKRWRNPQLKRILDNIPKNI